MRKAPFQEAFQAFVETERNRTNGRSEAQIISEAIDLVGRLPDEPPTKPVQELWIDLLTWPTASPSTKANQLEAMEACRHAILDDETDAADLLLACIVAGNGVGFSSGFALLSLQIAKLWRDDIQTSF